MKRILTTATALALLSGPALAQGPGEILKTMKKDRPATITKAGECNAPFPLSMLDERSDGSNCPDTATEKAVGHLLFLGTVGVGVHAATGGSFPLFAGGI